MEHGPKWVNQAQRELREILNEWDPVGVFPELGGPQDEYDCIRDPLISRLLDGESRERVQVYLQRELSEHFGLPEAPLPDEVADRIFTWWRSLNRL